VRLIAEDGEQVGIISLDDAQRLAEERELDLVEVAPNATPPVCRLMDYGKFRYEQSKKEREARKHQKQTELKEVRLRPKTDEHDLEVKAKQARRFLQGGDKVKFTLRFRGRELAHTNIGREILEQLVDRLRDVAVVEQKPTLESRSFSLTLAPNAKALKALKQAQQAQSQRSKAEKQAKADQKAAARAGDDAEPVEEDDEDIDDIDDDEEADDIDDIDDDEEADDDDRNVEARK
jgi:translation initiation factor IF-3